MDKTLREVRDEGWPLPFSSDAEGHVIVAFVAKDVDDALISTVQSDTDMHHIEMPGLPEYQPGGYQAVHYTFEAIDEYRLAHGFGPWRFDTVDEEHHDE